MVFVDNCYFMSVWFDMVSDAERHLIASLSNKKNVARRNHQSSCHIIYNMCVMCEWLVRNGPARRDSCP